MHNKNLPMFDLLKKVMQILNNTSDHYMQLRVNAENEYQAMRCGAFNPRFLAMVQRSNVNNDKNESKEK